MGLDISVYQNIRLLSTDVKEDRIRIENGEIDFTAYVIHESWEPRIKNLKNDGEYSGDCVYSEFSSGYISYSHFRSQLDNLSPLTGKGTPFNEVIDFADNEGCIDWETSAKLYRDFVDFHDKAMKTFDKALIWKYETMMESFRLGAQNGVVKFH